MTAVSPGRRAESARIVADPAFPDKGNSICQLFRKSLDIHTGVHTGRIIGSRRFKPRRNLRILRGRAGAKITIDMRICEYATVI